MGISATGHMRRTATALLILAIVLYGLFQARNLIQGPVITVHEPQNGEVVHTAFVDISGEVKNISEITLNDRHIFVDEEGRFREQLLLAEGYTIMTLDASDRFGRHTRKALELVYNK